MIPRQYEFKKMWEPILPELALNSVLLGGIGKKRKKIKKRGKERGRESNKQRRGIWSAWL